MALRAFLEHPIRREMKQRNDATLKAVDALRKAVEAQTQSNWALVSLAKEVKNILSRPLREEMAGNIDTVDGRLESLAAYLSQHYRPSLRELARVLREYD